MALILSLETATKVCSVALHENGKLVAIKEVNADYSHSENLTLFIQEVLLTANKSFDQIHAVAISKGPGSYTGLRIGVSSAKGLCYGLEIPLIAVETLQSLSRVAQKKIGDKDATYLPMIDARRMEVFCAAYDALGILSRATAAEIIDDTSFTDLTNHTVYFFGDGAEKCQSVLAHKRNFKFLPDIFPTASTLGEIAYSKFLANEVEDVAYFEPYYLKDFVATVPRKLI